MLLPVVMVVPMAFSSAKFFAFPPPSFSSRWLHSFFSNNEWLHASYTSLIVGFLAAVAATCVGVPATIGIHALHGKSRGIAYLLCFLPLLVPPIVLALALFLGFARCGLLDTVPGLALGHALLGIPCVVASTSAAFVAGYNPLQEKASLNLGASRWQTFVAVTLPQIRHGVIAGFLLSFLLSINEVVLALFLTDRNVITLSRKMWEGFRYEINPTLGVASLFAAALCFCLILLTNITLKRRCHITP